MNSSLWQHTACVKRRVTFSETDAVGYVHHANAALWFEQSRELYFNQFGVNVAEYARKGWYLALRELRVHYDSFVGYDDLLEVRCALTMLGRVAVDLSYRVDNRTTGRLALHGLTNMVAVERKVEGQPPVLGRLRFAREPFVPRVISAEAFFAAEPPPAP